MQLSHLHLLHVAVRGKFAILIIRMWTF